MLNKLILLNEKPKNYPILFLVILIFIIAFILSYKLKAYDSYQITGLVECTDSCYITFSLPYDKVTMLSEYPSIKYLNNIYEINKIEYSSPYLNNNIPYEDIKLYSNINFNGEKIINFNILYNKQRIIRKIINIVNER